MWLLIVTLFPNNIPLGALAGHIATLCLYPFLMIRSKFCIPQNLKPLLFATIAFSIAILFSLVVTVNRAGISVGTAKYVFVPLYWLFGLYVGITEVRLFGKIRKNFLFYVAAIFILVQLPLVFLQLIGASGPVSVLWSVEKTVNSRVVGTVANPNRLGILCVLAIIIFVKNIKQKQLWAVGFTVISVLIIFATGSRTSLVLLLILPFLHLNKKQLLSKYSIYILFLGIAFIALVYFLLLHFQNALPYMAEILDLVSSGEVHSLAARFVMWDKAMNVFSHAPVLQELFGLGAGYFKTMDNSYLYILFNYGIVGFITYIGLLGCLFITINLQDNKIALRFLLVSLVAGTVLDLMMSFLIMTFIYYLIGFKAELSSVQLFNSKNKTSKSGGIAYN